MTNLENNSFLLWNNPKETIFEFSGSNLPIGYARLVLERGDFCYLSWAETTKERYRLFDHALRSGGILIVDKDGDRDLVRLPQELRLKAVKWLMGNIY